MEQDSDDDVLVLNDESEGSFGLKVKQEVPNPGMSTEELFTQIDDCIADTETVPEPVPQSEPEQGPPRKYNYIIRPKSKSKPITAPIMTLPTSSVTLPTLTPSTTSRQFGRPFFRTLITAPDGSDNKHVKLPTVPTNVKRTPVQAPSEGMPRIVHSAPSSAITSSTITSASSTVISAATSAVAPFEPFMLLEGVTSCLTKTGVASKRKVMEYELLEVLVDRPMPSTSGVSSALLNRLGPQDPPQVPLAARLGPPVGADHSQVTSMAEESGDFEISSASAEPKAKRHRGPDRRPERNRALTVEGLTALDLAELARTPIRRPFQGDAFYNRNDVVWRELTHKDRTAREFSEWHMHLMTPRYMPVLSLATAETMIKTKFFVPENYDLQVLEFFECATVLDTDPRIMSFVDEVRECGFFSFDTEGAGGLPRAKIHPSRKNRLFIAMSSPKTAKIILFHCANDMPKSIRNLLAEYAIATIQSGIAGDVKLLQDAGIEVCGLIDSGVLYTLISPGSVADGFGAKRQSEIVWPRSKVHVPYEYATMNRSYEQQRLSARAKRHVIQDVLVPYAVLFEAAIRRVRGDGKSESDIFPYVNEALELCYTREPGHIRSGIQEMCSRDCWLPPVDGTEYNLNSKGDMTLIRRARGHYIERFDGPSLEERKRSAQQIWKYRNIPAQRCPGFRASNWCLVMVRFCQNCGGQDHQTSECRTPMVPCQIPHYPGVNFATHSILCCPQLHSRCSICRMRGHLDQQHPVLEQTPREFREDYMRYCHLGLYTSLPYLYEKDGPITATHWKCTLHGNRMPRGQNDLWLYRGPTYFFPQSVVDSQVIRRRIVEQNANSNVDTYVKLKQEPMDG